MQIASNSDVGEPEATAAQPHQWEESYRRHLSRYEDFTNHLRDLLEDLLKNANIDVIQIDGRAKSAESFAEKVRRKGAQYDDPLRQVTDLVGLRVITYYLEDVSRVGDLVRDEFAVDPVNSVDKAEMATPEQFGYRSVHYVATLGPNRRDLAEWAPFRSVRFEVQVRTSFQHAWAAVDHKLRYKTAKDVTVLKSPKPGNQVAWLRFSADGKSLFLVSERGEIREWNVAAGKETRMKSDLPRICRS